MTFLFIEYTKCSTCQKAKKWLQDNKVCFTDRHIVNENPNKEELKLWLKLSGKSLKNFFNTSGLLYKSMELKKRLPLMSEDEQLSLLASNGMLVKRPLIIGNDFVLIGFKDTEWQKILSRTFK